MSEFTDNKSKRTEQLLRLLEKMATGKNPVQLVRKYNALIENIIPSDVVSAVDKLTLLDIPISEQKRAINKVLNLLYKTLVNHPYTPPKRESFPGILIENNKEMDKRLKAIRPLMREINSEPYDDREKSLQKELSERFFDLEKFHKHYLIKENVLFPLIEKHFTDYRCLQVMWSFHDDIRKNIRVIIEVLSDKSLDLKRFNRLAGDIFFNMYAIKFREERILFPVIQEAIPEEDLNALFTESFEIGFPYFQPEPVSKNLNNKTNIYQDEVALKTGAISPEQIRLLFNHLPVDITFVDENNKVKYFSTPSKRIFPRTISIIGRDVNNCHPPESVHVVEQIVEAFRKGEKSQASFWINMKNETILIQYFAIRDENNNYKGVVEVSQEISDIKGLKGEKRLLEWDDNDQ